MSAFAYRRHPLRRFVDERLAVAAVPALRPVFAGIAAALLGIAAVATVEQHRIAALDADVAVWRARVDAATRDDARRAIAERDLDRLRAAREELAAIRLASRRDLNALVRIGNALPPQTWLTSVARGDGDWSIGGRAGRIDAVGTLLTVLDAGGAARLVSVDASRRPGPLEFRIAAADR